MALIDVISVENMRKSDEYTIQNITSSKELMWRAADGIFKSFSEWNSFTDNGYVAILAGSGNNGGDGYALSIFLKENNIPVEVFYLGNRMSEDASFYKEKTSKLGTKITKFEPEMLLKRRPNVIVDCLLGTGFKGTPREEYLAAINEINECKNQGTKVVSADINSGLNGDTGSYDFCVKSDLTVSIGYLKKGLISGASSDVIGSITVVDIGIVLLEKEEVADSDSLGIKLLSTT